MIQQGSLREAARGQRLPNLGGKAGFLARIARLESDVGHIQGDVADIKADLRGLRDKMDAMHTGLSARIDTLGASVDGKIGALDQKLDGKISAPDGRISALEERMDGRFSSLDDKYVALNNRIASAHLWALILYGALAATRARHDGARLRLGVTGTGAPMSAPPVSVPGAARGAAAESPCISAQARGWVAA